MYGFGIRNAEFVLYFLVGFPVWWFSQTSLYRRDLRFVMRRRVGTRATLEGTATVMKIGVMESVSVLTERMRATVNYEYDDRCWMGNYIFWFLVYLIKLYQ
jgi:hypothetical protein